MRPRVTEAERLARMSPDELAAEALRQQERERLAMTDDPQVLVVALTGRLGLRRTKLTDVVRHRSESGNVYRLTFDDSTVTLSMAVLLSRAQARTRIANATDEVVTTSPAEWDEVADMIMRAARDEEVDDETDADVCAAWLEEFADRVADESDAESWEASGCAAVYVTPDGCRHVHGPALRRWLDVQRREKVTAPRLGTVLRAGGCELVRVDLNLSGGRRAHKVWRLPE